MSDYTVGQRVMYGQTGYRSSGVYKETTVKVVRKVDVVCEDGTRWTRQGREWGAGDSYSARFLHLYDESRFRAANDEAERRNIAHQLGVFRWHDLTLPQLRAAAQFVNSLKAE